jgi:hypothetical protein
MKEPAVDGSSTDKGVFIHYTFQRFGGQNQAQLTMAEQEQVQHDKQNAGGNSATMDNPPTKFN